MMTREAEQHEIKERRGGQSGGRLCDNEDLSMRKYKGELRYGIGGVGLQGRNAIFMENKR